MCGHTRDPVIYSMFHRNPFRGFGAPDGQNLAFPITLASRFLADVNVRSRSLYAIARPSVVCRLSVVCDVGAPYSGG